MIASLAKLEVGQSAVIARLDRINGSVAKLWERSDQHGRDISIIDTQQAAAGEARLELGQKVTDLARVVADVVKEAAEQDAARKAESSVWKTLSPLIWMLASALLMLLFKHGSEVAAAFSRGH